LNPGLQAREASDLRYILEVKLIGHANRLSMWYEKGEESKDDSYTFDLNKSKMELLRTEIRKLGSILG
jgi:hypothetical protein